MEILIPSSITSLQKRKSDAPLRLMTYVVTQEVEEGVLLYNTLTCALARVSHEEAQHLTEVEGLADHWFLVPEDHDDKRFCKMLRIGARLQKKQPKGIKTYTILTTTGCNARCVYCYQQGTRPVHMTMETAEKVAQYIVEHRGEHEKVKIRWFGGEPLYNNKVMDRISLRLQEHGISFISHITTNGYLFGERMVEKAVTLWNVKKVQITIDGTEENYNSIKRYVHPGTNSPYQRVIENIKRLLETEKIRVHIRIHLNHDNLADVRQLTEELSTRFKGYDELRIYFQPIFELASPVAKVRTSVQRQALYDEKRRLQRYLLEKGIENNKKQRVLKELSLNRCMVDSEEAIVIVPDGHLGLCEHYPEDHFFGHIDSDEWDQEALRQMREYCEEIPECDTCAYYPRCFRLKICAESQLCFKEWREDNIETIRQQMLNEYLSTRK